MKKYERLYELTVKEYKTGEKRKIEYLLDIDENPVILAGKACEILDELEKNAFLVYTPLKLEVSLLVKGEIFKGETNIWTLYRDLIKFVREGYDF